jgi:hypothetical protein
MAGAYLQLYSDHPSASSAKKISEISGKHWRAVLFHAMEFIHRAFIIRAQVQLSVYMQQKHLSKKSYDHFFPDLAAFFALSGRFLSETDFTIVCPLMICLGSLTFERAFA